MVVYNLLKDFLYKKGWVKIKGKNPDFIVIGAQKAGTTWLYECLNLHPEVQMPLTKELHYFDMENHYKQGIEEYIRHFDTSLVTGDITPAYAIIPEKRVALMKQLFPNVKIIFILRNPIERAWSHALMNLCTQQNRIPEEVSTLEFLTHFNSHESLARGNYVRTINLYETIFDNNLKVYLYDDLRSTPSIFIKDLFGLLGLSTDDKVMNSLPLDKKVFASVKYTLPDHLAQTLSDIYRGEIDMLKEQLPALNIQW